jgi:hypothetical protein
VAKIIDFFDGSQSASAPTISNVSATDLAQYANDAAYEADNTGSPTAGNIYYNTTLDLIRFYDDGALTWRSIDVVAAGVSSVNAITGAVVLVAGTNITLTPVGQNITIDSTATGSALEIEYRTISAGENTAKQLTLAATPGTPTEVMLAIAGAPTQVYGLDFTVSGSVLSWSGTALDGILSTGDQVLITYNL